MMLVASATLKRAFANPEDTVSNALAERVYKHTRRDGQQDKLAPPTGDSSSSSDDLFQRWLGAPDLRLSFLKRYLCVGDLFVLSFVSMALFRATAPALDYLYALSNVESYLRNPMAMWLETRQYDRVEWALSAGIPFERERWLFFRPAAIASDRPLLIQAYLDASPDLEVLCNSTSRFTLLEEATASGAHQFLESYLPRFCNTLRHVEMANGLRIIANYNNQDALALYVKFCAAKLHKQAADTPNEATHRLKLLDQFIYRAIKAAIRGDMFAPFCRWYNDGFSDRRAYQTRIHRLICGHDRVLMYRYIINHGYVPHSSELENLIEAGREKIAIWLINAAGPAISHLYHLMTPNVPLAMIKHGYNHDAILGVLKSKCPYNRKQLLSCLLTRSEPLSLKTLLSRGVCRLPEDWDKEVYVSALDFGRSIQVFAFAIAFDLDCGTEEWRKDCCIKKGIAVNSAHAHYYIERACMEHADRLIEHWRSFRVAQAKFPRPATDNDDDDDSTSHDFEPE